MSFEDWIKEVDLLFEAEFGLSHRDFPDWNWMFAYDDGMDTQEAFDYWWEENQYDF